MKTVILLVLVTGLFVIRGTDGRPGRRKRNVIELAEVISCETKYSPFEVYLEINGYGCYCGVGGKGTPLDAVDICCQDHDSCYDDAQKSGKCPDKLVYTTTYHYKKHYCKSQDSSITCDPAGSYDHAKTGECAQELCECDTVLGKCLVGKDLNKNYQKYDKDKKC